MSAEQHLSVMRVRKNLIATLPPHPSDSTLDELQERVLQRINRSDTNRLQGVVLDVSAVETVDSYFARAIVETADMVELMGAHPILVGIRPAIAITATELGFNMQGVEKAKNTDSALDTLSQTDDIR